MPRSRLGWRFLAGIFLFTLPLCAHADAHFSSATHTVERVLILADERMELMPGVAAYKWQRRAPIADPERERVVSARAADLARTMGLAPEGVQAFFDLQILAAREAQAHAHTHWKEKGFDFAGPIPSLEADLRPRLDRITLDLLRALYLAAPELRRTDFAAAMALRPPSGCLRRDGPKAPGGNCWSRSPAFEGCHRRRHPPSLRRPRRCNRPRWSGSRHRVCCALAPPVTTRRSASNGMGR